MESRLVRCYLPPHWFELWTRQNLLEPRNLPKASIALLAPAVVAGGKSAGDSTAGRQAGERNASSRVAVGKATGNGNIHLQQQRTTAQVQTGQKYTAALGRGWHAWSARKDRQDSFACREQISWKCAPPGHLASWTGSFCGQLKM